MVHDNNPDLKLLKLEADAETFEVFETLALDFLAFIRLNPEKVGVLKKLEAEGNETAGRIVQYFDSPSPGMLLQEKRDVFLNRAKNTKLFSTYWGSFDLAWSDFVVKESIVTFSTEMFAHNFILTGDIDGILRFSNKSAVKKSLFETVLPAFLKSKGFKLKRLKGDSGHYYQAIAVVFHDIETVKPSAENKLRQPRNYAKQASATYEYEIVVL